MFFNSGVSQFLLLGGLCLALVTGVACGRPRQRAAALPVIECSGAETMLNSAWNRLLEAKSTPGGCLNQQGVDVCAREREEVRRLAMDCPDHQPAMFASAILAYEEGRRHLAQQQLDLLLERPGAHPDAAVLRGRIMLEDGNVPSAVRFLQQQAKLSPGHSQLREALASALFLAGRFEDSLASLAAAEKLGAPAWRVNYHRGVVHESRGERPEAAQCYRDSLKSNPGFRPAQARLSALPDNLSR